MSHLTTKAFVILNGREMFCSESVTARHVRKVYNLVLLNQPKNVED